MITYSFIVPMYNCEKTITRCVNSLLSQTYKNYEIILVDNMCSDNTIILCKDFIKHKKVRLIKCTKKGPSAARNVGLQLAKNDYVQFVDADDYLDNNYLEKINKCANSIGADIIFCGYIMETFDHEILQFVQLKESVIGEEQIASSIEYLYKKDCLGYTWCKLIRRSILKNAGILFDEEHSLHEDLVFTLETIKHSKIIFLDSTCSYHYLKGHDSLSSVYRQDITKDLDFSNRAFFEFAHFYRINDQLLAEKIVFSLFLIFKNYKKGNYFFIPAQDLMHLKKTYTFCAFKRMKFSSLNCINGKKSFFIKLLRVFPNIFSLELLYLLYRARK